MSCVAWQDERRQLLRVPAQDVRAVGGLGVLGHVHAVLFQHPGNCVGGGAGAQSTRTAAAAAVVWIRP